MFSLCNTFMKRGVREGGLVDDSIFKTKCLKCGLENFLSIVIQNYSGSG